MIRDNGNKCQSKVPQGGIYFTQKTKYSEDGPGPHRSTSTVRVEELTGLARGQLLAATGHSRHEVKDGESSAQNKPRPAWPLDPLLWYPSSSEGNLVLPRKSGTKGCAHSGSLLGLVLATWRTQSRTVVSSVEPSSPQSVTHR